MNHGAPFTRQRKPRLVAGLLISAGLAIAACGGAFSYPLYPGPRHPDTIATRHNEEGVEQYQLGHWTAAQAQFEAAIQADPALAEAHFNLGLTLDRLGAHAEAATHFKQAGTLAPQNTKIIHTRMYRQYVHAPS